MTRRAPFHTAILLTLAAVCSGGCLYSFKGGSVPSHLKTIAIPILDDQSGSGEANIRETFTNRLKDRFRQDNSLRLTEKANADALLEGTITGVTTTPLVVTTGETLSKQRVTITVKFVYQDLVLKKKVYEKEFSDYGDFDISGGPDLRQTAIGAALDKLTESVLNETVAGW
ncbi:MAG TPA: LptE family protein [Bacteroidota bacterium]|nr:LptE family protein [Bacteroidota bacterium]